MRLQAPTVLLVEDSAVVRAVLARQLTDCGYRVVEAADGERALASCSRSAPDVVILDLNLPRMSGYDVLESLKATATLADVPVIILTVRESAEDAVRGIELGAHDYLRKPVIPIELTARVGGAVRLKQALDELRRRTAELDEMSRTDFLTGLPNRRGMDDALTRMCAAARRRSEPLGVVIADVDRFKHVNDVAGHLAGDVVLREVAGRMSGVLRPDDILGRWGGDEFLVLLPGADAAAADRVCERIGRAVSERAIVTPDHGLAVTVTMGGAIYWSGDPAHTLQRADEVLYRVKTGRPTARPGQRSGVSEHSTTGSASTF